MLPAMTSPQRIASLLSGATEMLYGLGLGDRVVAVSHECDYPPDAALKPRVTFSHIDSSADSRAIDDQVREQLQNGGALYGVDAQRLEQLAPQLIVTQSQCDVCAVKYHDVLELVERSAVLRDCPVIGLNPRSIVDVLVDIAHVATAAGVPETGRAYVAELESRILAVRQRTAGIAPAARPRVACIEWVDPPFLAANWMPQLVEWAGGDDGGMSHAGEHSTVAGWDAIIKFDPQVILVMPCGFDLDRTMIEARALDSVVGWRNISAVRAGRAFAVDGNAYFNRPGPRLVESLEILAHLIHPEIHPLPANIDPQRTWQRLG